MWSFHQLYVDVMRCMMGGVASVCFLYVMPLPKYLGDKQRYVLCTMSRYSIGIYCISTIMLTIYYKLMGHYGINLSYSIVYPLLLTVLIMFVCYKFLAYCERKEILNKLFLGGR